MLNFIIFCFSSEGDENGRNVGSELLGSPPKLSRPSPRKLGFDENSPLAAAGAPARPSPKRQETPSKEPQKQQQKKLPVARLFGESEELHLHPLL